ncbi:MAG: sigma-70 family RNA polymerase sigma factor [Rivularia sp. ALOHA_DT_140]|nr:sigma-70 family RNA polymerase sigma factor [Rivularia sp. ALOHA_DT_140]
MNYTQRNDIINMFSTFIKLEEDDFNEWLVDSYLSKSMQNCLACSPEVSEQEQFWALYWYKQLESTESKLASLAKMHLLAYLQEPCYQVAKTAVKWLNNNPYSVADLFQMANAEVEAILKSFDPRKSSGLKEYCKMVIKTRLRDVLRKRKEADPCSNWALLRKVSKRELEKALKNAGLRQKNIAEYSLAWGCFNQLYVPKQPRSTKQLPPPSPQLWEAIANLYNYYRHQLTEKTPPVTAQTIEQWLEEASRSVRNYWFPVVKSLDIFNSSNDAYRATEDFLSPCDNSPMAQITAEEDFQNRQNQINRIFAVLSEALRALDRRTQKICKLYYQEKLSQQQIMQQLDMSQPTVSRQLSSARKCLLESLVEWSQNFNISIDSNQITNMRAALEEWLKNYVGDFNMS